MDKTLSNKINFKKNITNENFNIIHSNYSNEPLISLGYHYQLKQVRLKMNDEDLKKRNFYLITNEFEESKDENNNLNILLLNKLNYKIISNDFYKFWEILIYYNLINNSKIDILSFLDDSSILNCILNLKKHFYKNNSDNLNILSIKDNNFIFSSDVKNFINFTNNFTDNFYKKLNLDILDNLSNKSFDLIVTNPNIDNYFFDSFSNHEIKYYKIFIFEIILCLKKQKKNGNCVIKIYDMYTIVTLKLINILSKCYNNLYINKPLFSRNFENDLYLICLDFNIEISKKELFIKNLIKIFNSIDDSKYIYDIIEDFELDIEDIKFFSNINSKISNKNYEVINKIINYKLKNNYFGDEYHKYKDLQIKSNILWYKNLFNDNIDNILKNFKLI